MRWCAVVLIPVAAAMLSGCRSGGAKPAATATPGPTPSPTAAAQVVGPVLVYSFETPFAERRGNVETTIVAFDAGAWREAHRTVLPSQRVNAPALTSRGEIVYVLRPETGDGFELRDLNPVTGSDRVLYSSTKQSEWSVAVSPDGAAVAFTEVHGAPPLNSPADLRVMDIDTRAVRTLATFTDPLGETFRGVPTPRVWRDDGQAILVSGDTSSEAPGSWATVMLDGAMKQHGRHAGYPSPNGHAMAIEDSPDVICPSDIPQHLQLLDLDTGRVVAEVTDTQRALRGWRWSPDSNEILYSQLDDAQVRAACDGAYVTEGNRAFLLSVHGGPPTPAGDVAALRRRWYGDRIVDFQCGDQVAFDPYGECGTMAGRMFLNGGEVVRGEVLRVLGFIERPQ